MRPFAGRLASSFEQSNPLVKWRCPANQSVVLLPGGWLVRQQSIRQRTRAVAGEPPLVQMLQDLPVWLMGLVVSGLGIGLSGVCVLVIEALLPRPTSGRS